jgi:anaerobic selenocysteine-containing dehydrogenase
MQRRFLKICVAILSLALTSLPIQQAFAAAIAMDMTESDMTHCQNMDASGYTSYNDDSTTGNSSSMNDVAYGCCCDNCDTSCSTHCSLGAVVNALPATDADTVVNSMHATNAPALPEFSSHTLTPPSPPPLA